MAGVVLEEAAPEAATQPETSRKSRRRSWIALARATGSKHSLAGGGTAEAAGALGTPLRFVRRQLLSSTLALALSLAQTLTLTLAQTLTLTVTLILPLILP